MVVHSPLTLFASSNLGTERRSNSLPIPFSSCKQYNHQQESPRLQQRPKKAESSEQKSTSYRHFHTVEEEHRQRPQILRGVVRSTISPDLPWPEETERAHSIAPIGHRPAIGPRAGGTPPPPNPQPQQGRAPHPTRAGHLPNIRGTPKQPPPIARVLSHKPVGSASKITTDASAAPDWRNLMATRKARQYVSHHILLPSDL